MRASKEDHVPENPDGVSCSVSFRGRTIDIVINEWGWIDIGAWPDRDHPDWYPRKFESQKLYEGIIHEDGTVTDGWPEWFKSWIHNKALDEFAKHEEHNVEEEQE